MEVPYGPERLDGGVCYAEAHLPAWMDLAKKSVIGIIADAASCVEGQRGVIVAACKCVICFRLCIFSLACFKIRSHQRPGFYNSGIIIGIIIIIPEL